MNILKKTKAIIKFIFNNKGYLNGESYYPDEPHKSKSEMFWDQLYFILKFGAVESFILLTDLTGKACQEINVSMNT